jgi:hypothetical protein
MKRAYLSVLPGMFLLLPFIVNTAEWTPFGRLLNVPLSTQSFNPAPAVDAAVQEVDADLKAAKAVLSQVPTGSDQNVVLAVQDPATKKIDAVRIDKDTFLKKGAEATLTTEKGQRLNIEIVRPNGVNTAVDVSNSQGVKWLPLTVKYPLTGKGKSGETAYYTSVHPALASSAIAENGQDYVIRMMDSATASLASAGVQLSPEVVKVAERLCIVEHTDHKRFLSEDRPSLFSEISSLYALNSGDAYRYSVSTAGAGGMIQMIPSTYTGIRLNHPSVSLEPDFVEGMSDHANALKAMLLYMQDTWTGLTRQQTIQQALDSHLATPEELLAAGYNSNPTKLAGYIERGGQNWRSLIPGETQMYLQIYSALDNYFQSKSIA